VPERADTQHTLSAVRKLGKQNFILRRSSSCTVQTCHFTHVKIVAPLGARRRSGPGPMNRLNPPFLRHCPGASRSLLGGLDLAKLASLLLVYHFVVNV